MDGLWQATLNAASPSGRREFGCYIYYDNGSYSCVDVEPGPINTSCSKNSSIKFGKKDPKMCAIFHTHTTLEYCSSTKRRSTGPSGPDEAMSYASEMPCFVYDYLGGVIMGTQSKTALADVYTYGIERRQ